MTSDSLKCLAVLTLTSRILKWVKLR